MALATLLHIYPEIYKLSQNFTEGNTRTVSACFLRVHVCDVIKFRDDPTPMHINDPPASLARLKGRIVLISYVPSSSFFCQYCGTFLEMKI